MIRHTIIGTFFTIIPFVAGLLIVARIYTDQCTFLCPAGRCDGINGVLHIQCLYNGIRHKCNTGNRPGCIGIFNTVEGPSVKEIVFFWLASGKCICSIRGVGKALALTLCLGAIGRRIDAARNGLQGNLKISIHAGQCYTGQRRRSFVAFTIITSILT